MKVLITFLTYGENIFGGIEHSLYNFVIGLINSGNEVVVYTSKMFENNSRVNNLKVYYSSFLLTNFKSDSKNIDTSITENYLNNKNNIETELKNIVNNEKPNYILSIDHLWGIIASIDIWDTNCPIGLYLRMNLNIGLLNEVARMPFKHFWATSEYLITQIKNSCNNFKNKDIILLPNSIQKREYNQSGNSLGSHIIFCNSRLSPEKGIENLIRAFALVLKEDPDAQLYLCSGSFHFGNTNSVINNIRNICLEFPWLVNSIKYLPNLKWNEVPKYIDIAKVIVIPSKDETFGNAALEAMAMSKPIVYTKVGNLPNLIKDSRLAVEYGDVKGLAKYLVDVLLDRIDIKPISLVAWESASYYDNKIIAKQFINYISEDQ